MFKLMRNGLPFSIVSDCVFNSAYIELNFPQDQISDVCLASHLAHMAVSAPRWQKNPFVGILEFVSSWKLIININDSSCTRGHTFCIP